ncbi:MAG: hypothetical protein ACJ76P_12035 [Actinomycetota bacterium]
MHPERRRDVRLAYAYAQRLASEFELDFGAITFKVDHGVIHAIQVTRRIDERDVVRLDAQELADLDGDED